MRDAIHMLFVRPADLFAWASPLETCAVCFSKMFMGVSRAAWVVCVDVDRCFPVVIIIYELLYSMDR